MSAIQGAMASPMDGLENPLQKVRGPEITHDLMPALDSPSLQTVGRRPAPEPVPAAQHEQRQRATDLRKRWPALVSSQVTLPHDRHFATMAEPADTDLPGTCPAPKAWRISLLHPVADRGVTVWKKSQSNWFSKRVETSAVVKEGW